MAGGTTASIINATRLTSITTTDVEQVARG
jgi:hypothetical protein